MAIKLYTKASKVAIATEAVQISTTNEYVLAVTIQAKKANTGKIYVGDSSVSSTRCQQLEPGESVTIAGQEFPAGLDEVNLADLWFQPSVAAEGVNITYKAKRPTT